MTKWWICKPNLIAVKTNLEYINTCKHVLNLHKCKLNGYEQQFCKRQNWSTNLCILSCDYLSYRCYCTKNRMHSIKTKSENCLCFFRRKKKSKCLDVGGYLFVYVSMNMSLSKTNKKRDITSSWSQSNSGLKVNIMPLGHKSWNVICL